MKKFFTLGIIVCVLFCGVAFAATPPDVLKPYKAYRLALEKKDVKVAKKHALIAWKKAEKLLGASKVTGDLALNYANINATGTEKNPYKNYKVRAKAYKRAIELAAYYEKDAKIREVERRLLFAELEFMVRNRNGKSGDISVLRKTQKVIESSNLQGSTFDADLHALYSRYYQVNNSPKEAIKYSQKAIELYENRTDNYYSKFEYFIRVFKGDSHVQLAEKEKNIDEKINAALEYQTVMQNLEGHLPSDHVFVRDAFSRWMRTRAQIDEAGQLEVAEAAGLCECWPFEDYKNKVVPLKRIPPKFPSRVTESGHVNVIFDVTADGKPNNIREVNSTKTIFVKPALKSIEDWEFSKAGPDSNPKDRKDVTAKISFRLIDEYGNILPESVR